MCRATRRHGLAPLQEHSPLDGFPGKWNVRPGRERQPDALSPPSPGHSTWDFIHLSTLPAKTVSATGDFRALSQLEGLRAVEKQGKNLAELALNRIKDIL